MSARPSAGYRLAVTREGDEAPIVYRGFVHLPDADLAIVIQIDRDKGEASARIDAEPSRSASEVRALEVAASRLVKSAAKNLPRTIVRWREMPAS